MTDTQRDFDLVLLGATGFTGRLVAEHLVQAAPRDGVRWAVAARNADKLSRVMADVGAADVPQRIIDVEDADSVDELARSTRVVCTTVGPYSLYGSALLAACARHGTHYCDLAGEVHWIARMIEVHHGAAAESGARIVPCCGFDSVPSDLGTWFLQREARTRFGHPLENVSFRLKAARGGASGGTAASLMQVVEAARADRDVARTVRHPYSFNPPALRHGPDKAEPLWPRYDRHFESWVAPFVMGAINTKVVRRTNALLDRAYGERFSYNEAVLTGDGMAGRAKATMMASGINALMLGAAFKPGRFMLNQFVLPSPGNGPSAKQRQNGFFNIILEGRGPNDEVLRAKVTADRDPGYGATSRMLGEAALALAADDGPYAGGGVLTPAIALGDGYIERLEDHAGMDFSVID